MVRVTVSNLENIGCVVDYMLDAGASSMTIVEFFTATTSRSPRRR
jgi:uncharacterized protein YggE